MSPTWQSHGPFTVFDVETTGMSPQQDRIVEIAALRHETDGTVRSFHSLVNPERPIPYAAVSVHKITDAMVAGAPPFSKVAQDFLSFADGSILVAHHAEFDLAFLQEGLLRDGLPLWSGRTLDSIGVIKKVFPGLPSYSLGNLSAFFGFAFRDGVSHRALNDVEVTSSLFGMALDKLQY